MPVFEWWNDNWYALDFSGQGWGGWEPKQTWELAASRGDWEVQAKMALNVLQIGRIRGLEKV